MYILTGCKLSLEKQYRIYIVTFRFFVNFCQFFPNFVNFFLILPNYAEHAIMNL